MWKIRAGVVCSELGRESVAVTEASRPWEGMSASFKGEGRQPIRVALVFPCAASPGEQQAI